MAKSQLHSTPASPVSRDSSPEILLTREIRLVNTLMINPLAKNYQESSNISTLVDHRMGSNFTFEGMHEYFRLISWCVNPSGEHRPLMNHMVLELDRIREKEMSLTTIMGEGTTNVALGSQLFTS